MSSGGRAMVGTQQVVQQLDDYNHHSWVLSAQANQKVFALLGEKAQALSTGVGVVVAADPPRYSEWRELTTGAVVLVKDFTRRAYFIQVLDIIGWQKVEEVELTKGAPYHLSTPIFHQFQAQDRMMGIKFASDEDARTFQHAALQVTGAAHRFAEAFQRPPTKQASRGSASTATSTQHKRPPGSQQQPGNREPRPCTQPPDQQPQTHRHPPQPSQQLSPPPPSQKTPQQHPQLQPAPPPPPQKPQQQPPSLPPAPPPPVPKPQQPPPSLPPVPPPPTQQARTKQQPLSPAPPPPPPSLPPVPPPPTQQARTKQQPLSPAPPPPPPSPHHTQLSPQTTPPQKSPHPPVQKQPQSPASHPTEPTPQAVQPQTGFPPTLLDSSTTLERRRCSKKITKDMIGHPTDFKHLYHVGFNPGTEPQPKPQEQQLPLPSPTDENSPSRPAPAPTPIKITSSGSLPLPTSTANTTAPSPKPAVPCDHPVTPTPPPKPPRSPSVSSGGSGSVEVVDQVTQQPIESISWKKTEPMDNNSLKPQDTCSDPDATDSSTTAGYTKNEVICDKTEEPRADSQEAKPSPEKIPSSTTDSNSTVPVSESKIEHKNITATDFLTDESNNHLVQAKSLQNSVENSQQNTSENGKNSIDLEKTPTDMEEPVKNNSTVESKQLPEPPSVDTSAADSPLENVGESVEKVDLAMTTVYTFAPVSSNLTPEASTAESTSPADPMDIKPTHELNDTDAPDSEDKKLENITTASPSASTESIPSSDSPEQESKHTPLTERNQELTYSAKTESLVTQENNVSKIHETGQESKTKISNTEEDPALSATQKLKTIQAEIVTAPSDKQAITASTQEDKNNNIPPCNEITTTTASSSTDELTDVKDKTNHNAAENICSTDTSPVTLAADELTSTKDHTSSSPILDSPVTTPAAHENKSSDSPRPRASSLVPSPILPSDAAVLSDSLPTDGTVEIRPRGGSVGALPSPVVPPPRRQKRSSRPPPSTPPPPPPPSPFLLPQP